MMHAAAKVACSCMLLISNLYFVHRVLAFKESWPEPARVEASATRTTESPQCAHTCSVFPSSGWKKPVAGCLLSATFTMQTILSYLLDTITGDGRSSSNFMENMLLPDCVPSLKTECRRNGLFLVTSDPLHTAHERQARIQRQQ